MALTPTLPILAVSGGGPGALDAVLVALARRLVAKGLRVAGTIQHNIERQGRRCDMELELLPLGTRLRISEDRGAMATGCRLDAGALALAAHRLDAVLDAPFDVFLLNKFGAREKEGAGFRPALAAALMAGAPVVVGVTDAKRCDLSAFVGFDVPCCPARVEPVLDWLASVRSESAVSGE